MRKRPRRIWVEPKRRRRFVMPLFVWRLLVAVSIPLISWALVWLLWFAANAIAH